MSVFVSISVCLSFGAKSSFIRVLAAAAGDGVLSREAENIHFFLI